MKLLWTGALSTLLLAAEAAWIDTARQTMFKVAQSRPGQFAINRTSSPELTVKTVADDPARSTSPFPSHSIRITAANSELCDSTVKQYAGYLDVSSSKHIFFWFFESRNNPSTSPLILWFNGGPGCSSMTGLFFELGPCTIEEGGRGTRFNEYSWNENANILFIDQPVGVGFSYWEDDLAGTPNRTIPVDTSKAAAQDIYALLQLFFDHYPEYAALPVHIAAESYGGTYAPNFASVIHHENKKLSGPSSTTNWRSGKPRHINLASVILVNAMPAPLIQMGSVPEYLCGGGPFPVYKDPNGVECRHLRSLTQTCLDLINSCYDTGDQEICSKAGVWCDYKILDSVLEIGINPFDVRLSCDDPDGMCYKELSWIPIWMNNPDNRARLGVPPSTNVTFTPCSDAVHLAFEKTGDGMQNAAGLLTELINEGLRLLVLSGNADMLSNIIGTERWLSHLDSVYHDEFAWRMNLPWNLGGTNNTVGEVRSAGPGAGNVTFVKVYDAGHMAPHDQPEASLELITRWIHNQAITN